LKTSGETEDGVYDWMLLNDGKGWEVSPGCTTIACVDENTFVINMCILPPTSFSL
jgi:hypothetical protein